MEMRALIPKYLRLLFSAVKNLVTAEAAYSRRL